MTAGGKASRTVTRAKCVICSRKFKTGRRDTLYCSNACRQRAARSRAAASEIDQKIEAARRAYWSLVQRKAEAGGVTVSQVVTAEAQFVDATGNVFMGGQMGGIGADRRLVGKTEPYRPGWACWGAEAAGPPFSIPPTISKRNRRVS